MNYVFFFKRQCGIFKKKQRKNSWSLKALHNSDSKSFLSLSSFSPISTNPRLREWEISEDKRGKKPFHPFPLFLHASTTPIYSPAVENPILFSLCPEAKLAGYITIALSKLRLALKRIQAILLLSPAGYRL